MEEIEQVRRFNRLVTQRVGALNDHFLARDRPLGQARLLWEIGAGADVRALRSRLDLDSGDVSPPLRSLPAAGGVVGGRRGSAGLPRPGGGTIGVVPPDHEPARYCRAPYYAELPRRFEHG